MNTISIILISLMGLLTLMVLSAFIVEKLRMRNGSTKKKTLFEAPKYRIVVGKNEKEFVVAQNLTLEEAQNLQSTMNVKTRIDKED